jgi:alditol oxidase
VSPARPTNWAGNYTYQAREIQAPGSVTEAQQIVAGADRVRPLGSRHSFNAIADSDVLITLERLPAEIELDRAAQTVTLSAGLKYGALATTLEREGLALANLASLPHISVAGAIATGTHGSGDSNGNLATTVAALEFITAGGEVQTVRRGDPEFDGFVVSLGALGPVVRVTLDVEPAYLVRQRVFEHLPLRVLLESFDAIMSAGYSVSLFTVWDGTIDQVWVKRRVVAGQEEVELTLPGAKPAIQNLHPIRGLDPINCTPQLGEPGEWSDRLPHFRMDFTPSSGDELQTEYLVAREDAGAALEAVSELGDRLAPLLQVSEIRTIARDDLWLSPAYGRDSVAIHFTWRRVPQRVREALVEIEAALLSLNGRPHWGKVFLADAATIAPLYPRMADFRRLVARHDPEGAFRNAWLERHVLGRGTF